MQEDPNPLGMRWRLDEGRLVAAWCCGQPAPALPPDPPAARAPLEAATPVLDRYLLDLRTLSAGREPFGPGWLHR